MRRRRQANSPLLAPIQIFASGPQAEAVGGADTSQNTGGALVTTTSTTPELKFRLNSVQLILPDNDVIKFLTQPTATPSTAVPVAFAPSQAALETAAAGTAAPVTAAPSTVDPITAVSVTTAFKTAAQIPTLPSPTAPPVAAYGNGVTSASPAAAAPTSFDLLLAAQRTVTANPTRILAAQEGSCTAVHNNTYNSTKINSHC